MQSLFSKMFFNEVRPLIRLGRSRPLRAEDIPDVDKDLKPLDAEEAYTTLSTHNASRFVWDAYWAAGRVARLAMWANCLRTPLALSGPLLMRALLQNIAVLPLHPELLWPTLGLAFLLSLAVISEAVLVQHFFYYALKGWGRIANGLNMRVFRHSLRITRSAQQTTQSGDMVNHMASDSEGMAEAAFFVPEITDSLLLVAGALTLLFTLLGPAAFAAVATLLIMLPITRAAARRFARYDSELWKHRDDRVTLMSQVLAGIRIVKYFAWERSMTAEVDGLRAQEINSYVKLVRAESLGVMLFLSTSTLVAFSGFGAYVLMGGTLSAALIFPCLLLFMQLEGPIGALPHFIKNLSHARVAAERLHRFFGLATHEEAAKHETAPSQALGFAITNLSVEFQNATETQTPAVAHGSREHMHGEQESSSVHEPERADQQLDSRAVQQSKAVRALDAINLRVNAGESVAIVGAVGCGKTSLLLSLLGEVELLSGTIRYDGLDADTAPRISYVSQEAFILNATILENIQFGTATPPSEEIQRVLHLCALEEDIAQWSAGLLTEIGERGVNLSGGQKMRLALARAAMRKPGIVLLDDPLAAVDVHTEESLVDRLLFAEWSKLTRIVCTHRLAHLHRFDRVIFLHEGRIEVDAPLEQALQSCERFREFYAEHSSAVEAASEFVLAKKVAASHTPTAHDGSLVDEEDRATGSIKAELFFSYLQQLGRVEGRTPWKTYLALASSCLLVVVLPMTQSAWLAWWTELARHGEISIEWLRNPLNAVAVYGLIGLCVLLANFMERLIWMMRATMAGRDIHNQSLAAVLAAPLRFFDTTPMGRILNRFAHDMAGVDDELSWNFESTFRSFAQMVGTLVLIVVTVPFVLLAAAPALFVFYRIQNDYRRCAREAKRLSSIARSPRYAHFKETISGLPVIRAFRRQEEFTAAFVDKLEFFQRMNWGSIMLNRWFSTRAPLLSGVIALTTTTTIVWLCAHGHLNAGLAGVVITYSLTFWANLNWCVRSFSEVESRMTSYERLRAYSQLEPEPQTTIAPVLAESAHWPIAGTIEFRKVSARYADGLPLVLRSVDFRIEAGMRVGIVGRTGSGKTTIFQTLFRFLNCSEGSIEIDGVDIGSIPTKRLRRAMAVIPQDPMLFIGTVRSNLDRFREYSDEAVWSALSRVQMKSVIEEMGGLTALVAESGQNFSQGQRQLLCLARAILTEARIIVMDEATASVDVQTDALIQQTIREEFRNVSVLIIAHRLNSVADADMIIEMHHGEARVHNTASELDEAEIIDELS